MDTCQVCGDPTRWKNCSARCRARNAQNLRRERGRFQVAVTFTPATAHKLRSKAGREHGAMTRFVRSAVEAALRGGR